MTPKSLASTAVSCSPVIMSSRALVLPIKWVKRWVPPKPGMMPIATSGKLKVAFSEAMRRWQANANETPPLRAAPLMAAKMGLWQFSINAKVSWPCSANFLPFSSFNACISLGEVPVAKISSPAPVITTLLISLLS